MRVGLFDDLNRLDPRAGPGWVPWLGDFTTNSLVPGDPASQSGSFTPLDIVRRSIRLLVDFFVSIDEHVTPVMSMSGPRSRPGEAVRSVREWPTRRWRWGSRPRPDALWELAVMEPVDRLATPAPLDAPWNEPAPTPPPAACGT